MKGTDYQKKLEQLAKSRPSPGCHSATNAFRHLSIAWKIKDIDPDMAYFRGGCAEEEASTAIFHSLIDCYSRHQLFVQQCLSAFLNMLGLIEEDSKFKVPEF